MERNLKGKLMIKNLQKGLIGSALVLAFVGIGINSKGATYLMDPTNVFDTANGPNTSSGITATFQDISSGVVDLTLSVSGLYASYYNINTWWFMAKSTYADTFSISTVSQIGSFTVPTFNQRSSPSSEAGNDGYLNTWFNGSQNFENGDSVTYKITSSVSGLTASDFVNLDSPTGGSYASGGTYYSVAYILGSSQENQSFYIGATGVTTVPEPGTATFALLGLATLIGFQ